MVIRVAKQVVAVIWRMVPGKYYTGPIIAAVILYSVVVYNISLLTYLLYFIIMVKVQTEFM